MDAFKSSRRHVNRSRISNISWAKCGQRSASKQDELVEQGDDGAEPEDTEPREDVREPNRGRVHGGRRRRDKEVEETYAMTPENGH